MHIFSNYKRFVCVFTLFFLVFLISAQDSPKQITEESAISLTTDAVDSNVAIQDSSKVSGIGALIRVVVVLALVCVGIYGIIYILKKSTRINASDDPYLKNLALLPLGPSKSIQIVSAGSQAFVIGVSDHGISLISELSDKELIDAMILNSDKKSGQGQGSFASIFSKFLPSILPQMKETSESNSEEIINPSIQESLSASDTAAFLRSQRERLRNSSKDTTL